MAAEKAHHVIVSGKSPERGRSLEPFTPFQGRARSLKATLRKQGRPPGSANKVKVSEKINEVLEELTEEKLKGILTDLGQTIHGNTKKQGLIEKIIKVIPNTQEFIEKFELEERLPQEQETPKRTTSPKSPTAPSSMTPLKEMPPLKESKTFSSMVLENIAKLKKNPNTPPHETKKHTKEEEEEASKKEAIRLAKEEVTKPSAAPAAAAVAAPPVAPVDVPKMKKVEAMISKNLNVENPTATKPASVKKIKNHIGHRVKVSALTKPKLGESLYKEKLKKYFYNKKDMINI